MATYISDPLLNKQIKLLTRYLWKSSDDFEIHSFKDDPPNKKVNLLWTGLRDVNKKDIYEGDILKVPAGLWNCGKSDECLCMVVWHQTTASFLLEELNFNAPISPFARFDYDENEEMEIVGNRFDNPELLTRKT